MIVVVLEEIIRSSDKSGPRVGGYYRKPFGKVPIHPDIVAAFLDEGSLWVSSTLPGQRFVEMILLTTRYVSGPDEPIAMLLDIATVEMHDDIVNQLKSSWGEKTSEFASYVSWAKNNKVWP